jgi:hypothetical protein
MCFAFLSKIVRGQVTNVLFHENAFEEIDVQVLMVPHILEHIEELTTATPLFHPVILGDANTIAAHTQRFMYLPMVYVPLLLNTLGYTLCQVWERLYPALIWHQELEVCQPLITWLQAASMGTLLVNPQAMGDLAIALPLCAPPTDKVLLSQQLQQLHQILPGLPALPQMLEVALSQMAAALINQTNDQHLVLKQKAAEDLEPKLPSKYFSVTLPILLEYLQIADERQRQRYGINGQTARNGRSFKCFATPWKCSQDLPRLSLPRYQ